MKGWRPESVNFRRRVSTRQFLPDLPISLSGPGGACLPAYLLRDVKSTFQSGLKVQLEIRHMSWGDRPTCSAAVASII